MPVYALSFHTDDAQDVENERHLLELRKVAVQPLTLQLNIRLTSR